jgi:hypothetical protein
LEVQESDKSDNQCVSSRFCPPVVRERDDGWYALANCSDVLENENGRILAAGADQYPGLIRPQRPLIELGRQLAENET